MTTLFGILVLSISFCVSGTAAWADDTATATGDTPAAEAKAESPKTEAKAEPKKAAKAQAKKIKKSGMEYTINHPGRTKGKVAKANQPVAVHYEGRLENGTVFDSSRKRGEPFTFLLGAKQVIAGWDVGVEGMKEGEKRTLYIPAEMGYGDRGVPGVIPPKSKLIFDVELLEVKSN